MSDLIRKYERLKQENIDLGCKLMETEERLNKADEEIKRLRDGLDGLATHIWG
jgi:hypothetical protein